ncbi:unnamed protein product [Rotaria magnacalcarata]|uniref:Ig-like domain-containing protein n=2 Tax=Rotaria magnacalcarata TaxID=392030 RepID=A0A819RSM5_9BILA|nr:unnamed protein product [Rotaria magnacalcarata]CAF1431082.1 unnamed protein product [Rotaria magnacalcarata]CAF2075474.1 unnamed protein product [Rotaria magnacalcarata]CAF2083055.1 unnamed protein product [Rotaria magnacalcarata]CAF4052077.1 unnamed protein product [Rotaria magnacalcarata]
MFCKIFITLLFIIKCSSPIDIHGENTTIIAASNPSVTVTSGQKAILSCIFNRIDEYLSSYQLIWIRQSRAAYDADLILAHNQDLLIVDDRLNVQRTQNDYKLTLTDVTVDDEGTYACEVNTPTPQKSFIHLYVQGKNLLCF